MPRVTWSKVAKVLKEKYMEGTKCKICGKEIEDSTNALETLGKIYRHFKEVHPEKIEEAKQELTLKT